MRTATLFCFVGAILFVPTLSILRFVTDSLARTNEYAVSDLNTTFRLITIDLAAGRQVILEAPSGMMSPDPDIGIAFSEDVHDPNNNWIDEQTALPFHYTIDIRFWDINVEQETVHLLELQAAELDGGSSLSLNLTVRIEFMEVECVVDGGGTWRLRNFQLDEGSFSGTFSNVELRYESRFQLIERGGHRYLGQSIGQSIVTVNRLTVNTAVFSDDEDDEIINWNREGETDGEIVDALFTSVIMSSLRHASEVADTFLGVFIANRPYAAPEITLAAGAANASGYSCRRPEPRWGR